MKALPRLLDKIYQLNKKVLILCSNQQEMSDLDEVLWTYASKAFLPHATTGDLRPERQPILLSLSSENLYQAEILVILSETIPDNVQTFERCLDLFYAETDQQIINNAKQRLQNYQAQGFKTSYWVQNIEGNWQQE